MYKKVLISGCLLVLVAGNYKHSNKGGFGSFGEVTGVAIFKSSRSGSTWLTSLLGGLSDVWFQGEAFNSAKACHALRTKFDKETGEFYLRTLLSRPKVPSFGKLALEMNSSITLRTHLQDIPKNQKDIVINAMSRRHIVVGAFVTPFCELDLHAVLTAPFQVKGIQPSKLVLFLRTNVIKRAVAVLHDDPQYKVCQEERRTSRRLGLAHNLQKNCEFHPPDIDKLPVITLLEKIAATISGNERLFLAAEETQVKYLTLYYEDLQQNKRKQLRAFKKFVGIEWTLEDDAFMKQEPVFVKATSENLTSVIGARLVRELDHVFSRGYGITSVHETNEKPQLLAQCLQNMLHNSTITTFPKPCVAFFDQTNHNDALVSSSPYDYERLLRGLSTRAFCDAFITPAEVKTQVYSCSENFRHQLSLS